MMQIEGFAMKVVVQGLLPDYTFSAWETGQGGLSLKAGIQMEWTSEIPLKQGPRPEQDRAR